MGGLRHYRRAVDQFNESSLLDGETKPINKPEDDYNEEEQKSDIEQD